jgi:hypothetical protein
MISFPSALTFSASASGRAVSGEPGRAVSAPGRTRLRQESMKAGSPLFDCQSAVNLRNSPYIMLIIR